MSSGTVPLKKIIEFSNILIQLSGLMDHAVMDHIYGNRHCVCKKITEFSNILIQLSGLMDHALMDHIYGI
jgi:hypothetical protein